MGELVIRGQNRLSGKIKIQGSKNSALPIIAAALLTDEAVVIDNCPAISDVFHMQKIISRLGAECIFKDGTMTISAGRLSSAPDFEYCRQFRASSLFMGVLLSRTGCFVMPYPGGCHIGSRPVNFHIDGLRKTGAQIEETGDEIIGYCGGLTGGEYVFPYPSVGALENIIMGAVCAKGKTVLKNCAMEPEIVDLCCFLTQMGAKIYGAGGKTIEIEGVEKLHGCRYTVPGDRIAAGTYMAACAIAGGNICIGGIKPRRLDAVTKILRKTGCHVFTDDMSDEIIVLSDGRRKPVAYIRTGPYPEFPTDMQAQIMAAAAYFGGSCRICDSVFENRYMTAYELEAMGADITVDTDGVTVRGLPGLAGGRVKAHDLRGGAALVIAALGADYTVVEQCSYIERGYEDIQRDLEQLGADIRWRHPGDGTEESEFL